MANGLVYSSCDSLLAGLKAPSNIHTLEWLHSLLPGHVRSTGCHAGRAHESPRGTPRAIWIGGLLIGLTSTLGLLLLSRVSVPRATPLTEP